MSNDFCSNMIANNQISRDNIGFNADDSNPTSPNSETTNFFKNTDDNSQYSQQQCSANQQHLSNYSNSLDPTMHENLFINYLAILHREEDFSIILKGFVQLLNSPSLSDTEGKKLLSKSNLIRPKKSVDKTNKSQPTTPSNPYQSMDKTLKESPENREKQETIKESQNENANELPKDEDAIEQNKQNVVRRNESDQDQTIKSKECKKDALEQSKGHWRPTPEWVQSWKKKLPLQTIMRMLQVLVPQVEKMSLDKGITNENEILQFLEHGTLVGLLPVPHPILIRKYQTNAGTTLWFRTYMYGVIFLRNISPPIWFETDVKLFEIQKL